MALICCLGACTTYNGVSLEASGDAGVGGDSLEATSDGDSSNGATPTSTTLAAEVSSGGASNAVSSTEGTTTSAGTGAASTGGGDAGSPSTEATSTGGASGTGGTGGGGGVGGGGGSGGEGGSATSGGGNAGAGGSGGSATTGGSLSSGGAGGSGGIGGSTTDAGGTGGSGACPAVPTAEFFDFSSWDAGDWQVDGGLSGESFTYHGDDTSLTATYDAGQQRIHITGTVNDYGGFGLWLVTCKDASAYSGISFAIGGNVGAQGAAEFQVQQSSTQPVDEGGECASDCISNTSSIAVPASAGVVSVAWEEFGGGSPTDVADPTELLGVIWQFTCASGAACALDVTLDDVLFVP